MMAAPGGLLLGLDVGTMHVKAALVRGDGTVVHVARRSTPVRRSASGRAHHPAGELVAVSEAVVFECARVAADASREGPASIRGIGIASMAEAGTLIDTRNRPIGELIAWSDPRSEREAAEIEAAFGAADLFRRTGLRPMAKYSLAKILWLRRHNVATFRKARRWAGVAELMGLALTGAIATNASLACRTLAFDLAGRSWDPELLRFAGLTVDDMPPVLRLGTPVGGLSASVASRLGLPTGLPVAVAGHDHVVGAIGAGVVRAGMALDSMGSAEACLVTTNAPAPDEGLRRAGFSVGWHAIDDLGYVLAGVQASGALVEWFVDRFLPGIDGDAEVAAGSVPGGDAGRRRYAALRAALEAGKAGPGRVVAIPYPRGRTAPAPDPAARLAFGGLTLDDGPPEIAAAILDGAACAVRWIFDELEATAGLRIRGVRVIGGGSRIERWLTAKAALNRGPTEVVETEEATALGAALVGGIAGGVFGSLDDAVRCAAPVRRVPRSAAAGRRYEAFYRSRFLPLTTELSGPDAVHLRRARTDELTTDEIRRIQQLLRSAFPDGQEAFTEDDWNHALGGVHFILSTAGSVIAHASVVERELHVGGSALRTGYVEAVATAPDRHGRGFGTRVMEAASAFVRDTFELGALGTGSHHFYERLGWVTWRGPTSVRTPDGSRPTPDDDGHILVLVTPETPKDLDLTAPISCDWRPGDVW